MAACKDFQSLAFLPCLSVGLKKWEGGARDRLLPIDIDTVKSSISELWSLGQIAPINGKMPIELNRPESFTVFTLDLCGLMEFSLTNTC